MWLVSVREWQGEVKHSKTLQPESGTAQKEESRCEESQTTELGNDAGRWRRYVPVSGPRIRRSASESPIRATKAIDYRTLFARWQHSSQTSTVTHLTTGTRFLQEPTGFWTGIW
jgi:hypothetical protein